MRIIVQLLLAASWLMAGSAIAQSAPACSPNYPPDADNCADEGSAYAAASSSAAMAKSKADRPTQTYQYCYVATETVSGSTMRVRFRMAVNSCTSGTNVTTITRIFPASARCSSRPYELGWQGGQTAASVNVCHKGCMYTSSLDPEGAAGFGYFPTGSTCTESDAPAPTPAGDGGGDDGGGGGSETGGGDGGGDGGGGDGDGGGDGGGNGEGGGDGDGDGDGDSDGGGDGDGDGDGDGENPSLPENPTYPGDIPMPYADPPIPSSYLGQWSSGLGGGSCPAAKTITVGVGSVSTSVSFEFKPLCDFAQMIRGLVIACAALAAAYIVSGVRK